MQNLTLNDLAGTDSDGEGTVTTADGRVEPGYKSQLECSEWPQ